MLFDPDVHEPLTEDAWDPRRVRAAIRETADDAEQAFDDGWPTHPRDVFDEGGEGHRFRTVYDGGAGVVQALDAVGAVHRSRARVRGLRARPLVGGGRRGASPRGGDDGPLRGRGGGARELAAVGFG